eukprot:scaffold2294_cov106-Cylindrotheca_fusiformis.AAC.17
MEPFHATQQPKDMKKNQSFRSLVALSTEFAAQMAIVMHALVRRTKMKTVTTVWILVGLYYFTFIAEHRSITRSRRRGESKPTTNDGRKENDPISHEYMLQPRDKSGPSIAWLMSFPNSGTSYTMTLVGRASNRSFATNYGDEVTPKGGDSALSIYPHRPEGPFWPGMSGKMISPRPLPDDLVLTKTHCGSRCMDCGPQEYIETAAEFLQSCTTGHARLAPKQPSREVQYPPDRVAKAIHLIRNPFTNIISRYHQKIKNMRHKNETEWLSAHPNNSSGFIQWCKELDQLSYRQDVLYFGKDSIPNALCHGEFHKYTQWHNLVHASLELIGHDIPILTLYYEDFKDSLTKTANTLFSFLELEMVGELREYVAKTEISDYFTDSQKEENKSLVRGLATNSTWGKIHHYFEDL